MPSVSPLPTSPVRRGRPVRRLVTAGAAAIVIVGAVAGTNALASSGSTTGHFRTTTVTRANVAETVRSSAVIEPVTQATVAFPIAGTVSTVSVKAGDQVTTGQALAALDPTALQATVITDNATLAAAQLNLANALAGQSFSLNGSGSGGSGFGGASSGGTGGSSSGGGGARTATGSTGTTGSTTGSAPTTAAPTTTPSTTGHPTATTDPKLVAAQQAVLQGQQDVDRLLAQAQRSLGAATTACTAPTSTPPTTTTTTTAPTTTPPTTAPPTTAPPTTGIGTTACLTAQRHALADQEAVAAAQKDLAKAERQLNSLLASSASTGSGSGSTTGSGRTGTSGGATSSSTSSSRTSSSGSTGSTNGSSGSGSGSTATAQDLVALQAQVDAAQASLNVAYQALAQAVIVSPIAGTVAAVNIEAGKPVTAGSTTQTIIIVGPGGYEATTTVSVDNRPKIQVGDPATVTADGSGTPLVARIVAIGVVPTTSGTTSTYPVALGFDSPPSGLRNGILAMATITLKHAADVLTVPTSAVHTIGTIHLVYGISGGKETRQVVQIGAVGADRTEVTSGLTLGQTVVLADLSQPLPASNTASATAARLTGGTAGLGGGTLGGGAGGTGGTRRPGG